MRVEAALLSFGIFEAVELDRTLPDANRAEAADPTGIAEQFAVDAEAFLAIVIDDEARPAFVEPGIHVLVPEIDRLEDVTVGIDGLIGAGHGRFPHQRRLSAFYRTWPAGRESSDRGRAARSMVGPIPCVVHPPII